MTMENETATNNPILSSIEETRKKVTASLLPSIDEHVENDGFDSKKDGLDFLEVKNSILLSYLIDITQYLKLKEQQKKQQQQFTTKQSKQMNECMKRLREMKVLIEKMRPLEKKMRYQIDKLLSLSSNSAAFAIGNALPNESKHDDDGNNAEDDDGSSNGNVHDINESDPLAFRPNPENMDSKDDNDEESSGESNSEVSDNEDDDDEELAAARAAFKAGRSKSKMKQDEDGDDFIKTNRGIYKAPRLAAVPFAEHEKQADKEEKLLKKQRDRMRKSELLSTLKATFGDAPEEDDYGGGATVGKQRESARRLADREAEKTKFEEEAFIRLTTSRKDKKMRNRIMREEVSNLNSIADIGNLTAGVSLAFGDAGKNRNDDEIIRVGTGGSIKSLRHENGKRKRVNEFGATSGNSDEPRKGKQRNDAKNQYQKALFGMGSVNGKKKKKSRK